MYKHILSILVVFLIFSKNGNACSCIEPSSFCESIRDFEGNIYPEIILRGKIDDSNSEGKIIDIKQMIYGNIDESKFLMRQDFCTLYFNDLEDNAEYILAVNKNNDKYYLIGCAIGFLKIENEFVIGKVAPGINHLSYSQFLKLENCGGAFDQITISNNLNLFPNPTAEFFSLKNTSDKKPIENLELRIYNSNGKVIAHYFNSEGILPKEDWKINVQHFNPGLYLVQVSDEFQVVSYKIVKI